MRPDYGTITPSLVRTTARSALEKTPPWKGHGRLVTAGRLLDLLLLVADLRSSLSAIARRFRFGFPHETARQAVAANLAQPQLLREGLLDALYAFGARPRRKRRWDVAIDWHYRPFYGDRRTPGVGGGQKKHGGQYFDAYATATPWA